VAACCFTIESPGGLGSENGQESDFDGERFLDIATKMVAQLSNLS
jgi:hypothetical protein